MSWFLWSFADGGHASGTWRADGSVLAVCGVVFTPLRWLEISGPPPGRLVDTEPALPGAPSDPAQACPQCKTRRPV